jgi:NAD(P) transhydrogenase
MHYNVIVIGSGPAGEAAAINLSKHGQKVAVIEYRDSVGGACAHKGTIPSKALREAVEQVKEFNTNNLFRKVAPPYHFEFEHVLEHVSTVVAKQVAIKTHHYSRNRIDVIHGSARIQGQGSVLVVSKNQSRVYSADKIIIATGTSPYLPDDIDFNHPRIYSSDTILSMSHTPKHMIIFGAGVIGCEYASILSGLGIKIDLVDNRDRLLSFLDGEICDAVSYHLRSGGVKIRHNESYAAVTADERVVRVRMESGKVINADCLLFCNGRSGNTSELGLESVNIAVNGRSQLDVNENYETSCEGIYAIGDVIGSPGLASTALDQGRSVSNTILGIDKLKNLKNAPTGIYTIPEISSVGKTEEQLTEEKVPYEVGQAMFKDIARGQISNEETGMLKILFHRKTLQILGIHCFGKNASEIVHIGQAIMLQEGSQNSLSYFVETTFNYPTMAEAYRVAALMGLSRISK